MDVLLLSGYRPHDPLGLTHSEDGQCLLDQRILELKFLGLTPIVVLAGEVADEYVRHSRWLEDCELVYDTNGDQANLWSNVRSGLFATTQATFVLPVEVPPPPLAFWQQLKMELLKAGFSTGDHVLQLRTIIGAPWQLGFPLLISSFGRRSILELENCRGLTDQRLKYRPVPACLAAAHRLELEKFVE